MLIRNLGSSQRDTTQYSNSWCNNKKTVKVQKTIDISNLLCVDGIAGELGQMDEFQVKGPELSQDAAPG